MTGKVQKDDFILLYLSPGKKWLVRAKEKGSLHTHVGYLQFDLVIGKTYGSQLTTSLGRVLWLLKPTIEDFVMKGERRTQVVYPKDMGLIVVKTGVSPGSTVIEIGTGSGAMTTLLANLVRPSGRVYSYEMRSEFIEIAKRNLERAGLLDFVTLNLKDAREGLDVENADAAVIDVGDPWNVISPVWRALKGGAVISAITPTANQAEKLVIEMEKTFVDVQTVEILMRGLEARFGKTRPSSRMIGHTAYLTFGRKVFQESMLAND